jgi:hypothetical protein
MGQWTRDSEQLTTITDMDTDRDTDVNRDTGIDRDNDISRDTDTDKDTDTGNDRDKDTGKDTDTDRDMDANRDRNTDRERDHGHGQGHEQLQPITFKKTKSVESVKISKILEYCTLSTDVIFKFKNKHSSVTLTFKKIKNKPCSVNQRIDGQWTFQRTTEVVPTSVNSERQEDFNWNDLREQSYRLLRGPDREKG